MLALALPEVWFILFWGEGDVICEVDCGRYWGREDCHAS